MKSVYDYINVGSCGKLRGICRGVHLQWSQVQIATISTIGFISPTQIEEQILKIPALAPHYEIVVAKQGNLDTVLVKVELTAEAAGARQEQSAKELAHHIKAVVGISTQIEILPPGTIPRSEGKAKRVFDNRPKVK